MIVRDKTTQEIADIFDLDTTTIQKWIAKGCPCDKSTQHRQPHKFNEGEVAKWMTENNKTGSVGRPSTPLSAEMEALTLRKLAAQVAKAEREEKVSSGLLIDAADEQRRDIAKITTVRNRLSGLGATLAPQLQGLDAADIQGLIDSSLENVLKEFSK